MQQGRNGPSIHVDQNDQEGAHKSKNQREFATGTLRNELSGEVQKHANPEAGQPFNWCWGGKNLQHPASKVPAIRQVVSISPRACATGFRESFSDKWLSKVCFGICSLDFQALSSYGTRRTTFIF
jgi:hypothetical protein